MAAAQRFAGWLSGPGIERGLLGPRERERLWSRHLLNCAGLAALVADDAAVCDVGSGAGLPGIVLALQRRDCRITLLEPLLRRADFLHEVVDDLGLEHVRVVRARAEEHQEQYDVVTARAVAPLDRLARWLLPLTDPHGQILALKGSSARRELDEHRAALKALGIDELDVVHVASPDPAAATEVVRLTPGPPRQRRRPVGRSRRRPRGATGG